MRIINRCDSEIPLYISYQPAQTVPEVSAGATHQNILSITATANQKAAGAEFGTNA